MFDSCWEYSDFSFFRAPCLCTDLQIIWLFLPPHIVTTTATTAQVFTIVLTTPRTPPVFPEFPWGDEGVDYDDMNDSQWKD